MAAGAAAVVAYGFWGMIIANNLGLVTGSGLPLDETIAAMAAAEQPASMIPGYLFLVESLAVAAAWCILSHRRHDIEPLTVAMGWCALLTLGAPAFFYAGFWNLNSLGDTFADWHSDALLALERPLYLVSAAALIGLIALSVRRAISRRIAAPARVLSRR